MSKPDITVDEIEAVVCVLRSGCVTPGRVTEQFETRMHVKDVECIFNLVADMGGKSR
jgi:dTDP-4-amino-4,6-dideoxygalactose transaminase